MTSRSRRLSAVPGGSDVRLVDSDEAYRRLVGRRVSLVREWLHQSQSQMATNTGTTRNYISSVERGAQSVDAWRLSRLADALGVTPEWLLSRSNTPTTLPTRPFD